jgi:K+-transporting ATPase KdpF subunit
LRSSRCAIAYEEAPMILVSLLLSVVAFVYLVYAMLRPERF